MTSSIASTATTRPEPPTEPPLPAPPGLDDLWAAARRLAGQAVATPLIESPALNRRTGGRILIKAENLQRTGSFKFRGAYNKISQIPEARRAAGVVAYSSGNHAQGVAAAAQSLGVPATIVMPADAPAIKLENTRGYGAEVQLFDRATQSREQIGRRLAAERGATLVPPYDDPDVIAGQGTVALEAFRQAEAVGARFDRFLVCAGGGGLTAGCATALSSLSSETVVHTVEPAGFDDWARSLSAGERLENPALTGSICDALMAHKPGRLTFEINRRLVRGAGLAVSDEEVLEAVAFGFRVLKLVLEPGGAVALAAVLSGKLDGAGKTIGLTISGGNVDPAFFARAIQA